MVGVKGVRLTVGEVVTVGVDVVVAVGDDVGVAVGLEARLLAILTINAPAQ